MVTQIPDPLALALVNKPKVELQAKLLAIKSESLLCAALVIANGEKALMISRRILQLKRRHQSRHASFMITAGVTV